MSMRPHCLMRPADERFHLSLARDVAGDDGGFAALRADAAGDRLAGLGLAAGNHDLSAEARHRFGDGAPDAAA